ncbi:unnamed protein product [Miscanthus lutarioriparius]|uniref:Uncharacterized protein n=1 Tax=Miscanthus lutarioriparius TaxID=422564 RepID=A0A811NPH5_9POAL|nr:unnamed protein product [Miscanthus lutarioriparius]
MDGSAELVSNEDDLEDEEGCTDEVQNDEEGYNEDDQEGYNEVVIDGCGDDALAQDDWYDQEVDYGFDQEVDYGLDQDDEQEFEEFYLL